MVSIIGGDIFSEKYSALTLKLWYDLTSQQRTSYVLWAYRIGLRYLSNHWWVLL